ncbi:hypothetical protein MIMGU_mgv1a0227501mg, partial [Erythranthe guttata]
GTISITNQRVNPLPILPPMALSAQNSLLTNKSSLITQTHSPIRVNPSSLTLRSVIKPISAVHSADSSNSKTPIAPAAAASTSSASVATAVETNSAPKKWAVDSWKSKKALQLPEYPNKEDLDSVLKTLDDFPPIVFAGEARNLEERLGQAAMGNAFLLQGGDCAESFKEFNANNIRDTFRILLQMGAVLMFGGQVPVIKVGRMAGQFAKPRSDPFEEQNGVKLP